MSKRLACMPCRPVSGEVSKLLRLVSSECCGDTPSLEIASGTDIGGTEVG
jgi:hypothetical protein